MSCHHPLFRVMELQQQYAKNGLNARAISLFQNIIYEYYRAHKRDFLWRKIKSPYHVFVSEFMLQQTQTSRVEKKFEQFILRFPRVEDVARAEFKDVLAVWQGLGYNRRALMLHAAAKKIVSDFSGRVPRTKEALITLPGVGDYTANAVLVFAYNQAVTLIETNIRTVYLHLFFSGKEAVADNEILPLIEESVDVRNPREWYNALMDYGAMLKKAVSNPSRKSKHHTKQSRFEGSDRQVRGAILRELMQSGQSLSSLMIRIGEPRERVSRILLKLERDGLVTEKGGVFGIA